MLEPESVPISVSGNLILIYLKVQLFIYGIIRREKKLQRIFQWWRGLVITEKYKLSPNRGFYSSPRWRL